MVKKHKTRCPLTGIFQKNNRDGGSKDISEKEWCWVGCHKGALISLNVAVAHSKIAQGLKGELRLAQPVHYLYPLFSALASFTTMGTVRQNGSMRTKWQYTRSSFDLEIVYYASRTKCLHYWFLCHLVSQASSLSLNCFPTWGLVTQPALLFLLHLAVSGYK